MFCCNQIPPPGFTLYGVLDGNAFKKIDKKDDTKTRNIINSRFDGSISSFSDVLHLDVNNRDSF